MQILALVYATEDKSATDGKSSSWPNGEPKSVRDAADKQQGGQR
ncbi:hypothetical protein [Actinomadura chokoriensis]|uniref:Uncharacterized protein n=1 Tax=Actinomadura chokoriensis TaxID=454156 RepID=A0ABV4R2S4_9ACTN